MDANGAWVVILAGRQTSSEDLFAALRRARGVAPFERIAAVVPMGLPTQAVLRDLPAENVFPEASHRGTAFEVLLALMHIENRVRAKTPIVFLPSDHVVADEDALTRSLLSMLEWLVKEPDPVYLIGAPPEGPQEDLGYIVPWHDSDSMPTSVYEFVEKPDQRRARKLINAGALWNTFIFGGNLASLQQFYEPRFDAASQILRAAARATSFTGAVTSLEYFLELYDRLSPVDFSQEVLTPQIGQLNVLRMPKCGWRRIAVEPLLPGEPAFWPSARQ